MLIGSIQSSQILNLQAFFVVLNQQKTIVHSQIRNPLANCNLLKCSDLLSCLFAFQLEPPLNCSFCHFLAQPLLLVVYLIFKFRGDLQRFLQTNYSMQEIAFSCCVLQMLAVLKPASNLSYFLPIKQQEHIFTL